MKLTFAMPITMGACNIARMNESIGKRIARFREAAGLSQSELARRLSVKPQAVQKWEAGGSPRAQRFDEIAEHLGVTAAVLMGGSAPTLAGSQKVVAGSDSWPFKAPRAMFDALDQDSKAEIDSMVSGMIEMRYLQRSKHKTGS